MNTVNFVGRISEKKINSTKKTRGSLIGIERGDKSGRIRRMVESTENITMKRAVKQETSFVVEPSEAQKFRFHN